MANVLPQGRHVGRPHIDQTESENDKTNESADGQNDGQPKGNEAQRTPAAPERKVQTFLHVAIPKRKRENCEEDVGEHRGKIICAPRELL